jgi:hypothetical protein
MDLVNLVVFSWYMGSHVGGGGQMLESYPTDITQWEYTLKLLREIMNLNKILRETINRYNLILQPENLSLKLYCSKIKSTLSRRIPARVMSWQSYSSMRWRLWHEMRCSREASVISGQLSSSRTVKFSAAQGDVPRWRMPSSVMSSQWDRLWNRKHNTFILLACSVSCSHIWPLHSFGCYQSSN